ncbi:hypothetical protein PGB90_001594 [Kerria lacca]
MFAPLHFIALRWHKRTFEVRLDYYIVMSPIQYSLTIAAMNFHLPMTILGMTGIVGGLSVLLLPETANQGLTDTLEAIEIETKRILEKADGGVKGACPLARFEGPSFILIAKQFLASPPSKKMSQKRYNERHVCKIKQ